MSTIKTIPNTPVISRFSAPWDADCWYYLREKLANGSSIYSNTDIVITELPEDYSGLDYIVTFDSKSSGIDDHQESDFYVERKSTVYVAFDSEGVKCGVLPKEYEGWKKEKSVIKASNKTTYKVYSKEFDAKSHIILPGFEGDYRQYFVFAKAVETETPVPFSEIAEIPNAKYELLDKKEYKSYVSCVFSGDPAESGLKFSGKYSIEPSVFDENKMTCVLSPKASVSFKPGKGRYEIRTDVISGKGKSRIFGLDVIDGKVYCAEKLLCKNKKGTVLSISLDCDTEKKTTTYFVNHVKAETVSGNADISIKSIEGKLVVNNIYVSDFTEEYIDDIEFDEKVLMKKTKGVKTNVVDFPFKENKSLEITAVNNGSVTIAHSKISEGITCSDSRIFVQSDKSCVAISLLDGESNVVCAMAFYANTVFDRQKGSWRRLLGEVAPHCYYPAGNWYDVKFVVDSDKGTYDLWVDGAKLSSGKKLLTNESVVCATNYSLSTGTVYINRLRVSDTGSFSRRVFNGKVFNVKDYGAKGNGKTLDTKAIQKAIDAAAYTGGTVLVEGGTFFSGEIRLKSDMTLYVDEDAVILGTHDHKEYPLREPGPSLCAHRQLGRGLLYGERITNITITGGGMLDGNGLYRFKMNDPFSDRRTEDARPDIVYITYSDGIVIKDINFRRSSFWTVVPLSSRNITIKNLKLDCQNTPNRDGIDPVDCSDMTIYGCNVMAGDDGLCFKSSDLYGCKNIDVYDMSIQSLASAIKFGTDTYYSLEDLRVRDVFVKNVNRCAVSLESVDGAEVKNVFFDRIDVTDAAAPVYIVTGIRNRLPKGITKVRVSKMKGVTFKNINARSPRTFGHPLP
ncbi:MAG: hypothetical protein K6F14_07210, partial [Clostridiales bacterium]|nr:hypothetical protein [Clostridiales bacterium]